ncbi:MAG TPA: WGR domain-containing protein [Acidobacteriota bacterium]
MIRLENRNANHFKFYEFHGIEQNGRFIVKGIYGRIGQVGQETVIYDGTDKAEANKEFERKKNEKLKKGYNVVMRGGQTVEAPEEKKRLLIFL